MNGLCHPVILANGDVRAADSTFWKLLEQAQDAGINLSTGQSLPGNHQLFVPAHPSSQNQLP